MSRLSVSNSRQRGAIAILLGLSVFLLFGFMALAVDLGRTYVVRTELQNAADAAALAGAVQLNQTKAGVCCGPDSAVTRAIAMAQQNNVQFSKPVAITIDNLSVGSCPDDGCMVPASSITSDSLAAGKTFLRVLINSGNLPTFFAAVPAKAGGSGTPSTSTYGRAVAGHFVTQINPLGVCAIDTIKGRPLPVGGGLPPELVEFGFRRGVAYNIPQLNPLGGANGDPLWINPLNAPPATCDPANSSANILRPFVCTGTSTVITSVPGRVYVYPGGSYGPMEKALNSRFDDFSGGNACDPTSAPPDANVKSYSVPNGAGAGLAGNPRNWTEPGGNALPSQQTMTLPPNYSAAPPSNYGALWSYSRAVRAVGSSPNATAGTPFGPTDWPNLYNGLQADTDAVNGYPNAVSIPPFPPNSLPAPYYSLNPNKYFQAPSAAHPGKRDRRVLNVAIIDCSSLAPGPGLACASMPVLGVGRFFMQTPASLTGNPKKLEAEFAGLVDPLPSPVVRLYK